MKKYRPPSGIEGMIFMEKFCGKCIFDSNENDPCVIIANTMAFDIDDKEYPEEWIYDANNLPVCTKFSALEVKK